MASQILHRYNVPFFGGSSSSNAQASSSTNAATRNDVEMQAQPTRSTLPSQDGTAAADPMLQTQPTPAGEAAATPQGEASTDSAPQRPRGHGRDISGRSVLSNLSSLLAAMRQRDRDQDYSAAFNRLALAEQLRDLEAQITREGANGAAATGGNATNNNNSGSSSSAARRKEAKAKREREDNSTLFGPNLAHYFGSGSSSSGAVSATSMSTGPAGNNATSTAAASSSTAPAETPGLPGSWGRASARLGSRGRARGASLSGLATTLPAGSSHNDNPPETPGFFPSHLPQTPGADPASSSSAAAIAAASSANAVAMAEGIDIEVLKSWIERSVSSNGGAVEIDGEGEEAVQRALKTPSQCTTLQSLVNLKRNTINLMVKSADVGVSVGSAAQALPPAGAGGEGEGADHPLSEGAAQIVQESELRPARSLSAMPTFGQSTDAAGVAGASTHNLHFEYDCTSPSASVQIFLRASRKHGSWNNWLSARQQPGGEESTDAGSATIDLVSAGAGESLYHNWGPPPHVLGWPVHSSRVRRGFAQPVKAGLSLRLNLYAPPPANASATSTADAAPGVKGDNDVFVIDESQTNGRDKATGGATSPRPDTATATAAAASLPAIPDDETKEQRQAREKAERETLKLAIVVEALDEQGKPYAEPNLQTTYLRLTSLPVRPPAAAAAATTTDAAAAAAAVGEGEASTSSTPTAATSPSLPPARIWAAHVEGQEAEIGPHRFQLQELYGLSSRPPPVDVEAAAAAAAAEGGTDTGAAPPPLLDTTGSTGSECLICLSAPTNTLLLPCTHGLCLDCSVQLKESVRQQRESERRRGKQPKKRWNCPMCRRGFTGMLHFQGGEGEEGAEGVGGGGRVERMD